MENREIWAFFSDFTARGLLLTGPKCNGKTALIKHFLEMKKEEHPESEGKIVYIELSQTTSIKNLYQIILKGLDVESNPSTTPTGILHDLMVDSIKQKGVKMLCLDNLNDILQKEDGKWLKKVRKIFLDLLIVIKIPLILIGTEDTRIFIDKSLESLIKLIELPKWKNNSEFKNFLRTYERNLPLRIASHLDSDEIANKIFEIGQGILGNFVEIIKIAGIEAINNGLEQITLDLLNDLQKKGSFHFI
jgi:hypothetical protein